MQEEEIIQITANVNKSENRKSIVTKNQLIQNCSLVELLCRLQKSGQK